MNTVIIPCGGNQVRWGRNTPKQIISILDEPLLSRTLRLLKPYIDSPLVIAYHKEITDIYPKAFLPECCSFLAEAVYCTKHLWNMTDVVSVLLGDVIYSRKALEIIFKPLDVPIRFYGNENEIFAYRFFPNSEGFLYLEQFVNMVRAGHPRFVGRCWGLYYHSNKLATHDNGNSSNFTKIEDYTNDIDYYDEYLEYLKKEQNPEYVRMLLED